MKEANAANAAARARRRADTQAAPGLHVYESRWTAQLGGRTVGFGTVRVLAMSTPVALHRIRETVARESDLSFDTLHIRRPTDLGEPDDTTHL